MVVQGTRSLRVSSRKAPKPRYSGHRPRSSTGHPSRRSRRAATDQVAGFGGIGGCRYWISFMKKCSLRCGALQTFQPHRQMQHALRAGKCSAMETAGTMLARNNRCTSSILGASTLFCHVSPLMGIRRSPAKATHLAAFAPEPTKRLMPTLFAFLPFSCACIGCSFSHLSSSLYASIAASRLQSACCMYNVATSYLDAGGTLVS
jgi:hypothetical protein